MKEAEDKKVKGGRKVEEKGRKMKERRKVKEGW